MLLKGLQGGIIQYASKKQLSKLTAFVHKGICSLMLTEQPILESMQTDLSQITDEVSNMQLQKLLQQYSVLFAEPTDLTPKRQHDHSIPLKDETQVVKIKHYRFPTV